MTRAITNLGQVEDKLRSFLNLAGEVGLQFDPEKFIPVVVVGDADQPGTSTIRGRRFTFGGFYAALGAVQCFKFKFGAKCIIERLITAAPTHPGIQVRMPNFAEIAADVAATYTSPPSAGSYSSWREGVFVADGPPVQYSQNGVIQLGRLAQEQPPSGNQTGENFGIRDFCIEKDGVLCLNNVAAAATNLAIYGEGRLF